MLPSWRHWLRPRQPPRTAPATAVEIGDALQSPAGSLVVKKTTSRTWPSTPIQATARPNLFG